MQAHPKTRMCSLAQISSLWAAVAIVLGVLTGQAYPQAGSPNPTLLPAATTSQTPCTGPDYDPVRCHNHRYEDLNVPTIPAGGSYLDPTTNVKMYKLTDATYPPSTSGCPATVPPTPPNWGHDYSEGGNEVSLPHTGDTRTVLVAQDVECGGGSWWLIDFTPGVGLTNARRLTGTLAPWVDGAFTFSSNPATPWYAYVANRDGTIRRFDFRSGTMAESPGNGWPKTDISQCADQPPYYPCPAWLYQSKNDVDLPHFGRHLG